MMAGIVSWGSYIPKYRIKIEEIAKANGADSEQIKKSLLISEKSLPGIDEDSVTIAVEAARTASKLLDTKEIGAVYIGSESHPYAVKPTSTIVGEALQIGNNYTAADLEFACKGGSAAIQICLGLVNSKMIRYGLAGGADTAQAKQGDPLEYTAASGGAVFIIGNTKVVAEINDTLSFTSDTPDFWRKSNEKYPSHGGSFTGEPAYFHHVVNASKNLMKKINSKPEDYDYAVFHQPNGKFPRRAAKILGFNEKQILPGIIVDKIGNTYSGSSLLGLASVLDIAKPGQRIFLCSYGSGAGSDVFDITITDEITNAQKKIPSVESLIKNKIYVDYPTYLKNTKK
jgi:hydroxymethylglutaryl-CoA synthase